MTIIDTDHIPAIIDFALDHYKHFECYPMEIEVGGIIYTFEQYIDCIPE